jgi:nucleoside-diphosphate kinase
MPTEEPLAFKVEWFDQSSGLHRLFTLSFYEGDNSIEMFDIKLKRLFLRRCNIASVSKKELFLGNTIAVYGRHLVIKEYGNDYTKGQVENSKQSTLVLIYPEAHDEVGHVLDCLERAGYSLCRARSTRFTITTATEFYDRFRVKGTLNQKNPKTNHFWIFNKSWNVFGLKNRCFKKSFEF